MEAIASQAVQIPYILSQNPFLLLCIFVLVVIALAGLYFIATTPARIKKRVSELSHNSQVTALQLEEAAKVGHFGSFTWDLKDPSASVWSEEMFALCGFGATKETPQSPDALLEHATGPTQGTARVAWTGAQGKSGTFEITFEVAVPSDGTRYVRANGTTELGPDKQPVRIHGIAHDASKEVEVERSKSEFISLAAHQLKTPLTTIKWYAESLQKELASGTPAQKEYIGSIYDASVRMMDLVNDFLNMSRIELGTLIMRPVEVDICTLAQSVIDEQRPAADKKHVTLKNSCATDIPHMKADNNLTRMVVQNLISNAIKYTPEGGSVECIIGKGESSSESVSIRVTDTGIGIPKNEQSRIFERLHRASNAEKLVSDGTGLGLYIVKMIVDRVGGTISFESTEGKGTTFWATLPVVSVVWDK